MATLVPVVESSEVETIDLVADNTLRFAVVVLPVPPLVDVAATLLVKVPVVVPVTVTVTVQLELVLIVAPLKLTLAPFAAAVTVPPVQVVAAAGVAAFCIPVGYVSVNPTPVRATVLAAGLVMVKVITVVPFSAIGFVPNVFVMVGGATTVNVAVPGLVLLPALVFKSPAAIVLVAAPAVLLVTFTVTVQPPAGTLVPLAIVKLPAPAVAVTPVQVPVFPPVPIVIPVGKVSVSALVNVIALVLVFPIVTVRLVFPPLAILLTPKAFEMVGGINVITVTESPPVLLPSFPSVTLLFGSTVANGLVKLPEAVGVTASVTAKLPVVAPSVTEAPAAVQVNKKLPLMEQLIFPELVIVVNDPVAGAPYVAPVAGN